MDEQSQGNTHTCDSDPDVAIGIIDAALATVSKKKEKTHYAELEAKKGELLIQKYRNGNDRDVLEQAVTQYDMALSAMPRSHLPVYADVSFDAGNAYRELAALTEQATLCEKALDAYAASISYYTKDVDSLNHALILWNMAMAYHVYNACTGEQKYLSKAAQAFESSYHLLNELGRSKEAAQVAFSLGTTYGDLAYVASPMKHMRKGVEAYGLAAAAYHDVDPAAEGETNMRMGNLYVGMAQTANDATYIDKAQDAYGRALDIFTLDEYPDVYAQVSWSRGLAATVGTTLRDEHSDTGILRKSYGDALKVYTMEDKPSEWFHGNLNIGLSHLVDNISEPQDESYLQALASFERAWSVPAESIDPKLRAKVAHHYGTTLMSLKAESRPQESIVHAKSMVAEAIEGVPEEKELRERLEELGKKLQSD